MISVTATRRSRIGGGSVSPSIREVVLLAVDNAGISANPGESIAWNGRSYRVREVDSGQYLHVGVSDSLQD